MPLREADPDGTSVPDGVQERLAVWDNDTDAERLRLGAWDGVGEGVGLGEGLWLADMEGLGVTVREGVAGGDREGVRVADHEFRLLSRHVEKRQTSVPPPPSRMGRLNRWVGCDGVVREIQSRRSTGDGMLLTTQTWVLRENCFLLATTTYSPLPRAVNTAWVRGCLTVRQWQRRWVRD